MILARESNNVSLIRRLHNFPLSNRTNVCIKNKFENKILFFFVVTEILSRENNMGSF